MQGSPTSTISRSANRRRPNTHARQNPDASCASRRVNAYPPSKNRVWNFFGETQSRTSVSWSQVVDPHREIDTDATTTALDVEYTALYYYGYRFYDSELGRWVNRDPIQEDGGLNLFGFGQNCSLNVIDPDGRNWRDAIPGDYGNHSRIHYDEGELDDTRFRTRFIYHQPRRRVPPQTTVAYLWFDMDFNHGPEHEPEQCGDGCWRLKVVQYSEAWFGSYFRLGTRSNRTGSGYRTSEQHEERHFGHVLTFYNDLDTYAEEYSRRTYGCQGAVRKLQSFLIARRGAQRELYKLKDQQLECADYYPPNYTGPKPECDLVEAQRTEHAEAEANELRKLHELQNYTCP